MPAFISHRLSIRWLPDEAIEPTDTVVLTGSQTGCFMDVRFIKATGQLDWAFAGYRSSTGPNSTRFKHCIDSRTLNPLDVEDRGTNTTLPDGTILEVGEMVNPLTGKMTAYEEMWKDEENELGLFVKNVAGSVWKARVGNWQMGLGRREDGVFWAWQAQREGSGEAWKMKHSTESADSLSYLPERDMGSEGVTMEWGGDHWVVLEHSMINT